MAIVWLYLHANANPHARNRNNERTFGGIARNRALQNRFGISNENVHSFSNGSEILDAISQYSRIDRLVIFTHGFPDQFGWSAGGRGGGGISDRYRRRRSGWVPLREFTRLLGPKLVPNTIIGLAACSCGMGRTEWSQLNRRQRAGESRQSTDLVVSTYYNVTGSDSIAAIMRDQLSAYTTVEIRAHINPGAATYNPNIISFTSPANSPGFLFIRDSLSSPPDNLGRHIFEWQRTRGSKYEEWIVGGSPAGLSSGNRQGNTQMAIFPTNSSSQRGPTEVTHPLSSSETSLRQSGRIMSNLETETKMYEFLTKWSRQQELNLTNTLF